MTLHKFIWNNLIHNFSYYLLRPLWGLGLVLRLDLHASFFFIKNHVFHIKLPTCKNRSHFMVLGRLWCFSTAKSIIKSGYVKYKCMVMYKVIISINSTGWLGDQGKNHLLQTFKTVTYTAFKNKMVNGCWYKMEIKPTIFKILIDCTSHRLFYDWRAN